MATDRTFTIRRLTLAASPEIGRRRDNTEIASVTACTSGTGGRIYPPCDGYTGPVRSGEKTPQEEKTITSTRGNPEAKATNNNKGVKKCLKQYLKWRTATNTT